MKFIKITILFTLTIITYYSLQIPDKLSIPTNDKVGHFIAYTTLSLQVFLLCKIAKERILGVILIISYGVLMEFIQGFVPGREPSFYDMIANSSGTFFSLVIIYFFQNNIRSILRKIKIID